MGVKLNEPPNLIHCGDVSGDLTMTKKDTSSIGSVGNVTASASSSISQRFIMRSCSVFIACRVGVTSGWIEGDIVDSSAWSLSQREDL
jgi:hypothetical protein